MSDKTASRHVQELSRDDVNDRELACASDALFNDVTNDLKNAFRFGFAVAERLNDQSAAFFGGLLGEEARQKHTEDLEAEAMNAAREGRLDAARHILKRDIAYTSWTQGFDAENTQRLIKEINSLGQVNRVIVHASEH